MLTEPVLGVDFQKYSDGLVPAIVQDDRTAKVLMLGFMNEEALQKTLQEGKVTFYSRSKKRLWTKGEESGYFLLLKSIAADCDHDTLLVKADPLGPVCHTGADTCWNEVNRSDNFLTYLEEVIEQRRQAPAEASYIARLFGRGLNKIAQKVGEEAVEMVIEAKDGDRELFLGESADLLFHYLLLLHAKGHTLEDVIGILKERQKPKPAEK